MLEGKEVTAPAAADLEPVDKWIISKLNDIVKDVTSTSVGQKYLRSSVISGQPSVENGHNADENHVSSVSGSCSK